MSNEKWERLFYVTRVGGEVYSLHSVKTDKLILSEVALSTISDFLFLNEPTHPALTDEAISRRMSATHPTHQTKPPAEERPFTYYLSERELAEIEDYIEKNLLISYEDWKLDLDGAGTNAYCVSDLQLTLPFPSNLGSNREPELEPDPILNKENSEALKDFVDNPDNLLKAHKAQDIMINLMNKASDSSPNLYVVGGYSDDPKSQWDSNSEGWKDLKIEDD